MDLTAATATYDARVDSLRHQAAYDKQQEERRHRQEEARIVQLANHELNEQAERLTKKRDEDVYRVLQAEAQRELDKYHEEQHDDGALFRNKGTKTKQLGDDTSSSPKSKAKPTPTAVKSRPPAPPPSIEDVKIKQETASGSGDRDGTAQPTPTAVKSRPAAPPPSIRNVRNVNTKQEISSGSAYHPSYKQRVERELWDGMSAREIRQQLSLRGFTNK